MRQVLVVPAINMFYKTRAIKMAWYWYMKRQTKVTELKNQEIDPYIYKNSVYGRGEISDRKEKVTSQSIMLGQLQPAT